MLRLFVGDGKRILLCVERDVWPLIKATLERLLRRSPRASGVNEDEEVNDMLSKVFLDAFAELEHEISRVRRRIASDEEKDRRDYLETWIARYRDQQKHMLRLIGEGGARRGAQPMTKET
jgi:hypothetical protein